MVINLWAYTGEDGTILRLAGKSYVMQGSDAEKLVLLRQLAATDFLSAPWHKVPSNFTMQHMVLGEMQGVAQASMISDPYYHQNLFGPLIESLAQSIPDQVRSVEGEYQTFRLNIPQQPNALKLKRHWHKVARWWRSPLAPPAAARHTTGSTNEDVKF